METTSKPMEKHLPKFSTEGHSSKLKKADDMVAGGNATALIGGVVGLAGGVMTFFPHYAVPGAVLSIVGGGLLVILGSTVSLANHYKEIVLVPSLTFDSDELKKIHGSLYYEHRLLINLLLLANENLTLYYVTSIPLDPYIVEYYQSLSPRGKSFGNRLKLISPFDSTSVSLTEKLLSRPRLLKRIKDMINDPDRACVLFYTSTAMERLLSQKINLPILAVNCDFSHFGTKSGSKRVFEMSKVPYPDSSPLCTSESQLVVEIKRLIERNPQATYVMVKLNDSFSGLGNAILSLEHIKARIRRSSGGPLSIMEKIVSQELKHMRLSHGTTWEGYSKRFSDMGVIAEVFHENLQSPSCQGLIDDDQVIILSTHDQILTGLDHQIYSGCLFPSDESYRLKIQDLTRKIGKTLHQQGVKGFFGVDYILAGETLYAIEINLRITGTTHPMMTLKYLVDGSIDTKGNYISNATKKMKFYVSSDNLSCENFRKFQPQDVAEIVKEHGCEFNHETQVGCVLHMLGSVSEHGKMGITAISDSPQEAFKLYENTINILMQQAELE